MKIKPEHYEHLKQAIVPLLEKGKTDERYTEAYYVTHGIGKDHAKRFRWDALYSIPGMSKWICDTLYQYIDDTHIDSALKKIVKDYQAEK